MRRSRSASRVSVAQGYHGHDDVVRVERLIASCTIGRYFGVRSARALEGPDFTQIAVLL